MACAVPDISACMSNGICSMCVCCMARYKLNVGNIAINHQSSSSQMLRRRAMVTFGAADCCSLICSSMAINRSSVTCTTGIVQVKVLVHVSVCTCVGLQEYFPSAPHLFCDLPTLCKLQDKVLNTLRLGGLDQRDACHCGTW